MTTFRAFSQWLHTTIKITVDGVECYMIAEARTVGKITVRHGETITTIYNDIPVWMPDDPDGETRGVVDFAQCLRGQEVVGWYDYRAGWQGFNIPNDIAKEMRDFLEDYAIQNPDMPMFHTSNGRMSYNQLKAIHDKQIINIQWRVGAGQGRPGAGNQRGGQARKPGAHRPEGKGRQGVGVAEGPRPDTLFDVPGGLGSDQRGR